MKSFLKIFSSKIAFSVNSDEFHQINNLNSNKDQIESDPYTFLFIFFMSNPSFIGKLKIGTEVLVSNKDKFIDKKAVVMFVGKLAGKNE